MKIEKPYKKNNIYKKQNSLTCKKSGDKRPGIVPLSGLQSYKQNHIEKWVTSGIKNVHTNIETPEKKSIKKTYLFISILLSIT